VTGESPLASLQRGSSRFAAATPIFPSWPGIDPAISPTAAHSTRLETLHNCPGADGRVKPGHDGEGDWRGK
jgi:hypothetical protein